MTEEDVRNELSESERIAIKCACDTFRGHGERLRLYLASFVASVCDISDDDMLSSCSADALRARWMYFCAYRYMTNETYDRISKTFYELSKIPFTASGVANAISKMYGLIEQQPIWRKRWVIIKRVIKESNGTLTEPPTQITITVPKNVEVTIKKE